MTPADFYQKHSKLTRSLRNFISEQRAQFPEDKFERFLSALSGELERLRSLLMEVPAGPPRARRVQEMVDAEIARETNIPSTCAKGCSHCCHMEVEITNYETEILKDILAQGHIIDRERLANQSLRPLQDPVWRDLHKKRTNRCVFLGADEACEIYEHRPVMCRRHSVTSPPKNCETLTELISVRYFPRVDLILTAANEDPDLRIGPLAKMLMAT